MLKVFETERVDSLIPRYTCLMMAPVARQWEAANCRLCPAFLLDLRPEARYTFAPFGVDSHYWEQQTRKQIGGHMEDPERV